MALGPSASAVGVLYPGERMDIIVERLKSSAEPTLTVSLDRENLKFKNFALTPTQHFSISSSSDSSSEFAEPVSLYNLASSISPVPNVNILPTTASQSILIYTKVEILAEYSNIPKGFINRTSWSEPIPNTPPMIATSREEWANKFTPYIQYSKDGWVDIILNNMDEKGHPFHLVVVALSYSP